MRPCELHVYLVFLKGKAGEGSIIRKSEVKAQCLVAVVALVVKSAGHLLVRDRWG